MKKFIYISGLILTSTVLAQPQPPFIHSLDKYAGTANEVVTISGTGFTSPIVYFGKGKVSVQFLRSANVIEVRVPATATYGPVTVVNSSGLSAASSQLFSLSFDNDFARGTYSLASPVITKTGGTFAYDLCLCDFDGDDLLDAIVTHDGSNNDGSNNFGIELNTTSSPSSPSFNNGIDSTNLRNVDLRDAENRHSSHYAECADLNGDGEPDLVITTTGGGTAFIHIYQNTSSPGNITFERITSIQVPNATGDQQRSLKRIRLADIDGDGKPDIVVGQIQRGFNDIIIYLNSSSSSGKVLFNTKAKLIPVPGATYTASIFPGDLNNDGKIDLAILPYNASAQIYLMKNTSLPGSVSFELAKTIGSTAIRLDLVIADFNNDGLNDIASTQNNGSDFSFVEISQNEGNFTFLDAQALPGLDGTSLEGLDVGDMNGDGFADVIGASLTDDIVYIENTTPSSGSDITFTTPVSTRTRGAARNIRVGDINNDGKPDIVFTNNSISKGKGEMGYIINDNCMTPVIEPLSGKYCSGSEFILRATAGEGVTYAWTVTPGGLSPETSNELDLFIYNKNVSVSVTATSPDGFCTEVSLAGSYEVGSAPLIAPTITDPDVVCLGDDLSLSMSMPASATNYYWTGPNGFSSRLDSTTITNVSSVHSGTYTLIIDNGDCLSPEGTRVITISSPPVTTIEVAGCSDGSVDLQVRDWGTKFSYQWKQGARNVGTGLTSYTATTPGSYTLEITENANGCTYTSIPVVVYASTFTGVQFFNETEICSGLQGDFTAGETGTGVTWEVDTPGLGSVQTFTGSTLSYTFTVTGTKVSLFTTYADGIGCSSKTITVSPDPAFTITPSAMTKCSSDTVTLTLTGANTENGDSWTWDDDDPTTDLTGEISNVLSTSVTATYTATYTSGTGCQTITPSVTIANYPGIGVTATESTFKVSGIATTAVKRDTIIFAKEQTFVKLTADNSVEYTWTADSRPEDLDNSNTASVIVTPSTAVIMVTVSGQTPAAEGGSCIESTEIIIMSNSLTARKSFSPNGDGLNDCWSIINSRNSSPMCTIYVFDSRGTVIFEGDTPFTDDCIWDGNYNGKQTPEGIYYFAMKCDDSSNNQTGSILLAR